MTLWNGDLKSHLNTHVIHSLDCSSLTSYAIAAPARSEDFIAVIVKRAAIELQGIKDTACIFSSHLPGFLGYYRQLIAKNLLVQI